MMNREQLKQSLPQGAIKEIAKRLGVHYITVSRFLNNENIKNDKVEIGILEYLIETEKRKTELYNQLQSL